MKTKLFTIKDRYKFLRSIHQEYKKVSKKDKSKILNMCTQTTGLGRKYLISLLKRRRISFMTNKRKYNNILSRYQSDKELIRVLIDIWKISDFPCGKLLKPQLKTFIPFYEKEYSKLSETIKQKLITISPATIDRLLKQEKRKQDISTLKVRLYSKKRNRLYDHLVPIKTHGEWNFLSDKPGKLQLDLVAHDGGSMRGDFIQTLDMIDYKTGWNVIMPCLNKASSHVFPQLKLGFLLFPFNIVSVHSDSGKEFINAHLYRFCKDKDIKFTRSRPYKKDDNFWVENRNDKIVRRNVGYGRYEGRCDLLLLSILYSKLYLYINFFKPQRRCLKRIKIGSKIKKVYDKPQTPYKRVLKEKSISKNKKLELKRIYKDLNPIKIRKEILKLQNILMKSGKIKKEYVRKLRSVKFDFP